MRRKLNIDVRPPRWQGIVPLLTAVAAVVAGVFLLILLLPLIGLILAVMLGVALGVALIAGVWAALFWWRLRRQMRRWQRDVYGDREATRPRKKVKIDYRVEDS